jgi:general secretion pathway protein K
MRSERGAAMILAMLFAALAATIAVALAADQQRWLASVGHRRDQVQAQALALAGVQWARQVLFEDGRGIAIDHLGEPWAYALPPTPIENGTIEGRIEDAQGRLNVNNLPRTDAIGTAERARLTRLFTRLSIPPAALDAIADWIDPDSETRAGGAEDSAYLAAPSPSLAANAPLVRTAELAAIRGLSAQQVAALAPFVVALPAPTALNVNTAPPEVMEAAIAGLGGDALTAWLAGRARKPFTTIAEFRARLPSGATIDNEAALAVASSYFLVSVRARQGEVVARVRALVRRDGRQWPTIAWQVLE